MILGLIFILLGTLFLLRNLGFLPVGVWNAFWPSILILLGIYLIHLNYKAKIVWQKIKNPSRWKEIINN